LTSEIVTMFDTIYVTFSSRSAEKFVGLN